MINRRVLLGSGVALACGARALAQTPPAATPVAAEPLVPPAMCERSPPRFEPGTRILWGAGGDRVDDTRTAHVVGRNGLMTAAVSQYGGARILPLQESQHPPDRKRAYDSSNRFAGVRQFGSPNLIAHVDLSNRLSDDGAFVWSISSNTVAGGFRTGETRPARLLDGGEYELLPALTVEGNPLDDISWADGHGVGVGHFGTLGDGRRPAVSSPSPSFAVVDAAAGKTRSKITLASIFALLGEGHVGSRLRNIGCVRLRDGRVRFVADVMIETPVSGQSRGAFAFGVVVWTEGETPRLLADPFFGTRPPSPQPRMELSPDGALLLVDFDLVASGDPGGCSRDGQCSPERLTPVSGPTHGLFDIEANTWRWIKTATVSNSYHRGRPHISQDGQLGLVYLPEICNTQTVGAVIDMRDGRILKRILLDDSSRRAGFIGNKPYVAFGGRFIVHDV